MDDARAATYTIGAPVPRKEDARLLTGQGQFTDDYLPVRTAHAAFVRSPHAHARIGSIRTAQAMATPGVISVLTWADLAADGVGPIPHRANWEGPPDATLRFPPGFKVYSAKHSALVRDVVRFVGEPVAMVVAETRDAAVEAAALVEVEYDPLPAVAHAMDALEPGAAQVWTDRPTNVALDCEVGDEAATSDAFATAEHIVSLRVSWTMRCRASTPCRK